MRINIKSTNLDLTPPLKEYVEMKIGKLWKLISRFEKKSEVEVDVEVARSSKHHQKGNIFYAEANVRLLDGIIRAERFEADIRAAVDAVKDILQRELAKYKEKKIGNRKR